eukprot:14658723-Ditylum_brightwellii.AAC.2
MVDDEMIGCYYYENEGDNRSMRRAPRASRPPIQQDEVADELMKHYKNENKGDDRSIQCAPRASCPPI